MSTEIVKGNSGGPLVNRKGEIVGINTLRVGSGVDNLRLAIAINHIKKEIQDLKDGKQLLKNKERNVAESVFRSQLSSLNTKISDDIEISKAISNAYNQSSFDYDESRILSGIDSTSSSQENLRKGYLETIIRGYKILIPALETFKNLTKSFNDSYSDKQTYLSSINNNYQRKKLTEFSAYTSSKVVEYDKKIGEIYGKISAIEGVIKKGDLKNLSAQYFLQQKDLFKADVGYITKQKEDFLSMLWIRLLF